MLYSKKAFASGLTILAGLLLQVQAGVASSPYSEAVSLFNQGKYKQAADVFDYVISSPGDNTNALYYAGLCNQKLGRDARSKVYYMKLIRDHPSSQAAKLARQALGGSAGRASVTRAAVSKPARQSAPQRSAAESSGSNLPDSESVPFRRNPGGHLIVTCQVNGRTQQFIFDTGAELTVLGLDHLRALGISPPAGKPIGAISGVGGQVGTWDMTTEIALGNIKRRMHVAVAEKYEGLPLLGQTFFSGYHYDIDNSAGAIRFSRSGSKRTSGTYDTIDIPFQRVGEELVVTVKVNGKSMKMIFDTGAQGTMFPAYALSYADHDGWTKVGYSDASGVGGGNLVYVYDVREVSLGPITERNMRVTIMPAFRSEQGLLGQDFFGRRKFTIDYDKSVIRFAR